MSANAHLTCILLCLFAGACRRDMSQQDYAQPLESSEIFKNGMASRPIPANTVARGQYEVDSEYFTGRQGNELVAKIPIPVSREMISRGKERFEIYCAMCHGMTGEGNGVVVQRGFPAPPSYHIDRLRTAPAGHLFDVITHGFGIMYPYGTVVRVSDRWAIVAYIRCLQLSQHASLDDLSDAERRNLEKGNSR